VAATNKDLATEVKEGRFREDLYYRLNVITVYVPPLRDRTDDVALLADFFLRRYADKNGKELAGFTRAAMDRLVAYHWPGNVRELENVVERAVVLTKERVIDEDVLPRVLFDAELSGGQSITVAVGTPLEEVERPPEIMETLRRTRGDKRVAAQPARHRHPHDLPSAGEPARGRAGGGRWGGGGGGRRDGSGGGRPDRGGRRARALSRVTTCGSTPTRMFHLRAFPRRRVEEMRALTGTDHARSDRAHAGSSGRRHHVRRRHVRRTGIRARRGARAPLPNRHATRGSRPRIANLSGRGERRPQMS